MNISTNIVSSLEKCKYDSSVSSYFRLDKLTALLGEHINFQLIFEFSDLGDWNREIKITANSDLGNIRLRRVKDVCITFDSYPSDPSRGTAKMLDYGNAYPDILEELENGTNTRATNMLTAIWADVTVPDTAEPGEHEITLEISYKDEIVARERVTIDAIGVCLPEGDYKNTMWFHVDCLSSYYDVPVYSERHWEIIENYMKNAVENSINTILVPVLTPPLDTAVGHERPTTQLVRVRRTEQGKYEFGFELLDRYIALCKKVGVKYFEISHLFSQWGAKYAPKVMAEVFEDGEWREKRIFGWDTPGTEGEYPLFLAAFIPSLREHLVTLGILENCIFHISDEPNLETVEGYKKAKAIVAPLLAGLKVVDACSHAEFAAEGIIENPIPTDTDMDGFLALDLPERWTYYCCVQTDNAPNRFICYPSFRNRILGIIMYKFGISGFLQWAYNFYYTCGSVSMINPYTDASGDGWVPAGDTFMVYPGRDGKPVESLRLPVFAEAFSDLMALKKCEELCGRDAVLAVIDRECQITFKNYPANNDYILKTRAEIGEMIKNAMK